MPALEGDDSVGFVGKVKEVIARIIAAIKAGIQKIVAWTKSLVTYLLGAQVRVETKAAFVAHKVEAQSKVVTMAELRANYAKLQDMHRSMGMFKHGAMQETTPAISKRLAELKEEEAQAPAETPEAPAAERKPRSPFQHLGAPYIHNAKLAHFFRVRDNSSESYSWPSVIRNLENMTVLSGMLDKLLLNMIERLQKANIDHQLLPFGGSRIQNLIETLKAQHVHTSVKEAVARVSAIQGSSGSFSVNLMFDTFLVVEYDDQAGHFSSTAHKYKTTAGRTENETHTLLIQPLPFDQLDKCTALVRKELAQISDTIHVNDAICKEMLADLHARQVEFETRAAKYKSNPTPLHETHAEDDPLNTSPTLAVIRKSISWVTGWQKFIGQLTHYRQQVCDNALTLIAESQAFSEKYAGHY